MGADILSGLIRLSSFLLDDLADQVTRRLAGEVAASSTFFLSLPCACSKTIIVTPLFLCRNLKPLVHPEWLYLALANLCTMVKWFKKIPAKKPQVENNTTSVLSYILGKNIINRISNLFFLPHSGSSGCTPLRRLLI